MDSFNGDNTIIRAGQDELSPIDFSMSKNAGVARISAIADYQS